MAFRFTSSDVTFFLMATIFLVTVQTALVAHGQTDPCLATCCSRGWNFYGEGNFSKLGVNGSSDCNCFDTQLTKCSTENRHSVALESADWKMERDMMMSAQDDHCNGACCNVGSMYYGYGDYARYDLCNCAMQAPQMCSTP